jgi:hypothetical protein
MRKKKTKSKVTRRAKSAVKVRRVEDQARHRFRTRILVDITVAESAVCPKDVSEAAAAILNAHGPIGRDGIVIAAAYPNS